MVGTVAVSLIRDTLTECFSYFVTPMTASAATMPANEKATIRAFMIDPVG